MPTNSANVTAEYVHAMLNELALLSQRVGLNVLADLIEAAAREAQLHGRNTHSRDVAPKARRGSQGH